MSTLFGKKRPKRKRIEEKKVLQSDVVLASKDPSCCAREQQVVDEPSVFSQDYDSYTSFDQLGLTDPLVATCKQLGFSKPTPVQRQLIPFLVRNRTEHCLALAATGTGKTAAYVLPILHHLSMDPYGIYAVIVTPTRELAKQIHQQVIALGSAYNVQSVLVVGGLDSVQQSCQLQNRPHVVVATPGRFAALLRDGPQPSSSPRLQHARYLVLDEADRLLANNSGFERDVAELLLHCQSPSRREHCQTLLFSATMTSSLSTVEELAGGGGNRIPLRKFIIRQDNQDDEKAPADEEESNVDKEDPSNEEALTVGPKIPVGLQQEYIFMPARVRDAYLLATVRTLLANGGRSEEETEKQKHKRQKGRDRRQMAKSKLDNDEDDNPEAFKAKSAIIFVSTCERAALISGILEHVGVANVALHSLLSQHRRLAALGKFQSEQVRVMVATDVAARGLDIPNTDLVINCELPRNAVNYVHRVGRTARAGRRGRAVSLVAESDIALVHAAERASGRELVKNKEVTDEIAVSMLGPATKAARLTKLKLQDIGFDELVQKFQARKARDRKERQRLDKALRKQQAESM